MNSILLSLIISAHLLIPSKDLNQRAQYRADHMTVFSHDGWKERFTGSGYNYIGENLARGFDSATSTFDAFMASPSHRANIMSRNYRYVGIGYSTSTRTTVVLFGNK